MGKTSSRNVIFKRRRINAWKYLKLKNILIVVIIVLSFVALSSVASMKLLEKKAEKSTIKYAKDKEEVKDNSSDFAVENNHDEKKQDNQKSDNNYSENTNMDLMVLGEIMMGGKVTTNLDYNYLMAFKNIYDLTKKADFTYADLSTNITNLDKIEDAKTNYLVTKNILSAFNALGLDALSIANDHITDYPSEIIKNTESLLEENSIYVVGKKDMPMYFEKDGKKIAIVSTNSVIIGTKENYTKNGISVYDEDNIKKNIQEAKKMADFVIVDIHWGKGEESFGVTTQMEEMAKFVIESGADLVMGTHAIGIQPISTYNGKPIIYTTGYAMTDLEYETTKVSYLFDLKFENTKLSSIEMTPIYIKDSKEVLLYKDYDEVAANINMKSICSRTQENGLNAGISDNKIIVKF
ncbi:MAG: CapA family protein [Christensenellales bacterium]